MGQRFKVYSGFFHIKSCLRPAMLNIGYGYEIIQWQKGLRVKHKNMWRTITAKVSPVAHGPLV